MESPRYVVRIIGANKYDGTLLNGTGFIVDKLGHVVTCWHVVSQADEITVKLPYNDPWKYQIYKKLESEDIVILESIVPPSIETPYASLHSDWKRDNKPGVAITVWGYSAPDYYTAPQRFDCTISGFSEKYGRIGLNGDVNFGDSGGPVLDADGKVIGIAQVRDQNRSGQAMAIPISLLFRIFQPGIHEQSPLGEQTPKINANAILRLQQTGLFKKLLEKEDNEIKKTSLVDHEISQNISSFVNKVIPFLEIIPKNMPEFTLHNSNHSINVIKNIEKLILPETLEQLNTIEISILIYAAYLHDIGMIASSDERKQIIKTSEFKSLLTSSEELYERFKEAKNNDDYETAADIENEIFTSYLRKNHVYRAHKIISEQKLDSKISWRNTPYCNLVRAICDSHELPVKDLYNTKSWPNDTVVVDQPVNVQYLAILFRLADILDINSERTPKYLFYYINPKDKVNINEWKKHISITGFKITPEKIKIIADCKHPEQERTLREFIKKVDKEIEDSYRLVLSYRDNLEKKYKLKLSEPVDPDIHSIGYEYSEFRFELDYRRVLDLLMGEGLYGDPIVALRELLQNSIDAVRYRESLEKRDGNGYTPYIEVSLKNNELIVEDNGIGMDKGIFENYFMKVGRSYYQSSDFREKNVDIDPVSEFGIGILSVFMVADKFTVDSRRKTFEDEFNPSEPVYFEIPTAYDYFVKRSSNRSKPGTKITLYLKPNNPFSAETLSTKISELAPFIEYPIVVYTANEKEIYEPLLPGEFVKNDQNIKKYFEVLFDNKKEGIEGTLLVCKKTTSDYSIFAQKGFSIPYDKLLPNKLFYNIQASVNFSGQYKVLLSPSRSDVVKDEKYYKLINKIQSKILEGFDIYLQTLRDSSPSEEYVKCVNELLENNILSLHKEHRTIGFIYQEDELEDKIIDLFLNYAPLLTISDDGQRVYKTMNSLNATSLAITDINDWPEIIPDAFILKETKRLAGAKTILLMHEENGKWRRNNFFGHIIGEFSDIYITSIPGVVIKTFHKDKININHFLISSNDFTSQIYSDPMNKVPLFVHPPDFSEDEIAGVIYNANHPLFAKLLDCKKPKDEAASKAINILISNIENCLWHLYDKAYFSFFKRHQGLKESSNINYMLIGILKYYPEIFQEFYEAVEQYWEEAKDLGVISRDEDFIGFSLDDLPWFWNYELTDFEI